MDPFDPYSPFKFLIFIILVIIIQGLHKKQKINALLLHILKARNHNPDEFYFKVINFNFSLYSTLQAFAPYHDHSRMCHECS